MKLLNRAILCLTAISLCTVTCFGADLSRVAFWNGEAEAAGPIGNYWGGTIVHLGGTKCEVTRTSDKRSGAFGYDVRFTQPVSDFAFFMHSAGGFGPSAQYVMTRDLSPYSRLEFWLKNPGRPFWLDIELKDYRDSGAHSRKYRVDVPTANFWRKFSILLSGAGWTITGQPDVKRTRFIGFIFLPKGSNAPLEGSVQFDDMDLIETGPSLEINTTPLNTLVDRTLRRLFLALWGSRSRDHGLMPLNSFYGDVAALNSTAGLVQLLPTAISRGWVTRTEADAYITQLLATVEQLLVGRRVPPRYVDWVTLQPNFVREESPVDAALLVLALYKYSAVQSTSATLRNSIRSVITQFNFSPFASFASPVGWRLAYNINTGQMTDGVYDSYSGEVFAISLAAHLSGDTDIAQLFHSGSKRVKTFLVSSSRSHVVAADNRFRAMFLQWLWPLHVKLDGLPIDTYPNPSLATNPLDNARLYQTEVLEKLRLIGRETLLQPDAGDNGSGQYEQYSLYNVFGQPELYFPWSATFMLLSDPTSAANAIRKHLNTFNGPYDFADAVKWQRGAPQPSLIVARADFWNCCLAALAMAQYLDPHANTHLTNDATVRTALNRMYPRTTAQDYLRHAWVDPETAGTEILTAVESLLPFPYIEGAVD